MRKCVNITYITISKDLLFRFRYKRQVLYLMRLQTVWILPLYCFSRVNETLNTALQDPYYNNRVYLAWFQLFDVKSSVSYFTGGDIQIPNKKYYR